MSIAYTGKTRVLDAPTEALDRFPPASPTEERAQFYTLPETWPYALALLFVCAVALILVALYAVAMVNSHAFAVLCAFVVAGFLWFAFGVTR